MNLAQMTQTDWMLLIILVLVGLIALLVLITGLYVVAVLKIVLRQQASQTPEPVVRPSFWQRWLRQPSASSQTDAAAPEQEYALMLDHNYDGIRELDNHMPPWLKFLYFATVVFSVGYLLVYHVFSWAPLQDEEFEIEMQQAAIAIERYRSTQANLIDENNVELLNDAQSLAEGKKIYEQNCVACHAADGGGGVGPNLTDEYWIHGCDISDVFRIVKYGVPQKGMVPWEASLRPQQIQQVASYVLSLQGVQPANPKEPQGELCQ